jgi:hypothetical protein
MSLFLKEAFFLMTLQISRRHGMTFFDAIGHKRTLHRGWRPLSRHPLRRFFAFMPLQ